MSKQALHLKHDGTVEEITIDNFRDLQEAVGGLFDVIALPFGDLFVNDEAKYTHADQHNRVATDVAGLGGRVDILLFDNLLGDCVLMGKPTAGGDSTSVSDEGRRIVRKVTNQTL